MNTSTISTTQKQYEYRYNLLKLPSRPIIDPRRRLALFWSDKSGCTFAVKWIFAQMNLLTAALEYHEWIHHYREQVYDRSQQYSLGLNLLATNPSSFQVIKVVRNPFDRAVSSYIHACSRGYEDNAISLFLNRQISPEHRFSFREFIAYLFSIDLTQCNEHHQLQTHAAESSGILSIKHLVYLEHINLQISHVEKKLNLPHQDLNFLSTSSHHTRRDHSATSQFMGDECLQIYQQESVSLPLSYCFYDQELMDSVANLYKADLLRYGYSTQSFLAGNSLLR
jgi:hypothetical protein